MEISNPRRILAVSLERSQQHLSQFVKDLTGIAPQPASTSLAGTTHTLEVKTVYYTAAVPIWLDLIPEPSEWSASFLSPEAKEVLEVLGAVIVVFQLPVKTQSAEVLAAKELIQHVGKVVKQGLGGWEWDGVGLCLGIGEVDDVDEWDECAAECGLEFVQVRAKGGEARNEFGEKTGIPRALEALEANDWEQIDSLTESDFGDFETPATEGQGPGNSLHTNAQDLGPESLDFGFDKEDFAGLKRAIYKAGEAGEEDFLNGEPEGPARADGIDEHLDDDDIQKLDGMMRKLQAVKDMSAGLPEEQRKRMAAKAVNEVMKDL